MKEQNRPLRVLMLATYFPKPLNHLMGNWALAQAQALLRNGVNIRVVSFTAWVPRVAARSAGARAYAFCPQQSDWDGLPVFYPRWLVYPTGLLRRLTDRYPTVPMLIGWLTARSAIQRMVNEFQPDLIYAHHTAVNGYLAEKIHQETGLPYVVTDHDFGEIHACRQSNSRKRLFEKVVTGAAAMIAVARRMESEMKSIFPAARTLTVQNGTNPIPNAIRNRPRPAALGGKSVIFSCGTFYGRKAFPLLVEAFAALADRFPDAVLRIAGDGEERPEVEAIIRRHGLGDRITLLGFQPQDVVLQELVWCDIFALVGWDEPFATVYVEAMAAGKPIICCSDGGITDVLQNEVHGLTVPPRDQDAATAALARLLDNPALRTRMGSAALECFDSSLHWDHHASRMLEIFTKAVERA